MIVMYAVAFGTKDKEFIGKVEATLNRCDPWTESPTWMGPRYNLDCPLLRRHVNDMYSDWPFVAYRKDGSRGWVKDHWLEQIIKTGFRVTPGEAVINGLEKIISDCEKYISKLESTIELAEIPKENIKFLRKLCNR